MTRVLDVYLFDRFVGKLIQNDMGKMQFRYDADWLKEENTSTLSQSLPKPLSKQASTFSAKECLGFFGGILPEESIRERIAKNLGISKENSFAMLAEIGGECAGAVSFIPEGGTLSKGDPHYQSLSEAELAVILNDLPRRPLMAGEAGVRLSLAGAQDKITIRYIDNHFSIPLNGAPSTHILKPAIRQFEDSVTNEAVCMKLAGEIGLPVAEVEILQIENVPVLSVARFDRQISKDGSIKRLHQEDFCQALGIVSEMKYQSEGGVSLKQAFSLLRTASTVPAINLQHLLDATLFNFFIGNNDAHGKNFSLLYEKDTVRLSPLYDLLSTAYYPELSKRMAMNIGREYRSEALEPSHFEKLAVDAGLSKSALLQRVPLMANKILAALPKVSQGLPAASQLKANKLIEFIDGYATKIRKRFD